MLHIIECDNCGTNVKTGCFDLRPQIVTYHTPPILYREILDEQGIEKYMMDLSTSAMTSLCLTCIETGSNKFANMTVDEILDYGCRNP